MASLTKFLNQQQQNTNRRENKMAIYHYKARCGGGKTTKLIQELVALYSASGCLGTVIVASKTTTLSAATMKALKQTSETTPCIRLDSKTCGTGETTRQINQRIEQGYRGILFVTHKALPLIQEHNLGKLTKIFIDEVPQDLLETINVTLTDSKDTVPAFLNIWLNYESLGLPDKTFRTYQRVTLKPEYKTDATALWKDIKAGHTPYSEKLGRLLKFLLDDFDILYHTSSTVTGGAKRTYQAVQSVLLQNLLVNVDELTILAANLQQTLVGQVMKYCVGAEIIEVTEGMGQKHSHKITIYPLLKEGSFSGAIRDGTACEKLNTSETCSVNELFQKFCKQILQQDYLLFKNTNTPILETQEDGTELLQVVKDKITVLSTAVHGLNDYLGTHKGAFIASLRPTPQEVQSLQLFASAYDVEDSKALIDAVVTERCYEACYQCLLRTSARLETPHTDQQENVFVVPDLRYAEYLKNEWFEEGCVEVNTDYSYTPLKKGGVGVGGSTAASDARLQVAVAILTAKKNKVGSMPEILNSFNVHRNTLNNYKKEFRAELVDLGLLKK